MSHDLCRLGSEVGDEAFISGCDGDDLVLRGKSALSSFPASYSEKLASHGRLTAVAL